MCLVDGCELPKLSRGMCKRHYTRWWKYGDPLAGRGFQGLTTLQRFWQYVEKSDDGCWVWRGPRSRGYGVLADGNVRGCPFIRAHVFSWRLHNDNAEILDGLEVRHLCGNPPCCNPGHLVLGTHAQNMQDMIGHDRSTRGERDAMSKLTRSDVDRIRQMLAAGRSHAEIAPLFEVTRPAISLISSGARWGWYVSPSVAHGHERAPIA
jgi:hypothetical protein